MDKILLVDKPSGWTSFDVVAKIRGTASELAGKRIKVGHAGTLDPFATGLLIVLLGQETKNQDTYMKLEKGYEATLRLGYTSTTGDPEGKIEKTSGKDVVPNLKEMENVFQGFLGEISQTPPAYSAIKVGGRRAYKLAREGKEVKLEARKITIHSISILDYSYPSLAIKVKCSSGTYIRTLAEDIGSSLGCGAYLTALRRISIGDFNIENAEDVDKIVKNLRKE
jgi:tRNA pseudouridine55 synthase